MRLRIQYQPQQPQLLRLSPHRTISSFLVFTFSSYLLQLDPSPIGGCCTGWLLSIPSSYHNSQKNTHEHRLKLLPLHQPYRSHFHHCVSAVAAASPTPTVTLHTSMTSSSTSTTTDDLMVEPQQCEPWDSQNPQHIIKAQEELRIWPLDEYNIQLLNEVHPIHYTMNSNETTVLEYDLIAIGSGAGGLVSSKQSARRNAKSALISAHLAGGDCLNVRVCVSRNAVCSC